MDTPQGPCYKAAMIACQSIQGAAARRHDALPIARITGPVFA